MEQAFKFIIINWESISLILMGVLFVAEKLVKLSPAKWDDIVVDGIREIVSASKKRKDRNVTKQSGSTFDPSKHLTKKDPNEGR